MPLMNILRRSLACNDSEIMIACPLICMPLLVSQITSVSFELVSNADVDQRAHHVSHNASIFDEHSSTYGSSLHLKFQSQSLFLSLSPSFSHFIFLIIVIKYFFRFLFFLILSFLIFLRFFLLKLILRWKFFF